MSKTPAPTIKRSYYTVKVEDSNTTELYHNNDNSFSSQKRSIKMPKPAPDLDSNGNPKKRFSHLVPHDEFMNKPKRKPKTAPRANHNNQEPQS